MKADDTSYEIIVVGAGVIGCAVARELAPDYDVLVLEKGQVAGDTTAKASGWITMETALPEYPDAARYAKEFFKDYDGTGNLEVHFRDAVGLIEPDAEDMARDVVEDFQAREYPADYWEADELEARYPGVFVLDDFAGGVEYRDTGWVEPYTYATTLKEDAEDRGAVFETGVEVEEITTENGRVSGVRTADAHISSDHVVCATGWRTRSLVSEYVEVPVRPFRWQSVNLEVDLEIDEDYPMAFDWPITHDKESSGHESRRYWRPELNGELHIGGGTYFVQNPGDVRESATEAFRDEIATMMPTRIQGVEDARFASDDCCPTGDAATPDDMPIVDAPEEGPNGLILAIMGPVGGIMGSPFVARAVRSLVTGEEAPFPVEPHSLSRFEDRSTDFDCWYVTGWAAPDEDA